MISSDIQHKSETNFHYLQKVNHALFSLQKISSSSRRQQVLDADLLQKLLGRAPEVVVLYSDDGTGARRGGRSLETSRDVVYTDH